MRKDRILITGATGFLGKHLIKRFKQLDLEVYGMATRADLKNNIIEADLKDLNQLKQAIKRINPDIIYHLGALVNLTRDFQIAKECFETNLVGTLNLLEALREIKIKRFIFSSTEEVYGNGKVPYKENQKCLPPSPYAISKKAAEELCEIYAQDLNFSLLILRIGTMYGFTESMPKFIQQTIMKALKNEAIPLNSGVKKRDYIYIRDVVEVLVLSRKSRNKSRCEIMNVGGGKSYSLLELVDMILKITKSKSNKLIGIMKERDYEPEEWLMDINIARRELGWKPNFSLNEGLKKTIEQYEKNLV
jgi:nucleoside-diphosphate-sugar epimerase